MHRFFSLLKGYFSILFFRRAWNIGYRFDNSDEFSFAEKPRYNIIKAGSHWWYADPFCVKHNNEYYIFCEMLDSFSGIGSIGLFIYANGTISDVRQIIKEQFHMSYPNVFRYKDNYYMIPETGEANQIRLYKAANFPFEWKLDTILADSIKAVDSTILYAGDEEYLFTYDISENESKLLIYRFDIANKKLYKITTIPDRQEILRPAGNFIYCGDTILRPAQYGKDHYGEKIIFYGIENMPDSGYKENESYVLSISQIFTSKDQKFTRLHTINRCNGIEVIDLFESHFCIIKPLIILAKLMKGSIKRMK